MSESAASVTSISVPAANAVGNKANQRALRALVIGVKKQAAEGVAKPGDEPGVSQTIPNDPFSTLGNRGDIIEPPFDVLTLAMLNEHSSELGQCIEAMETNIDGFGHRLVSRVRLDDANIDDAIKTATQKERVILENFFAYAAMEDSFTAFRRKLRKDIEQTGNAYFEVIRSAAGRIQGFTHIPSYQMRLGKVDDNPIEAEMPILELQDDGSIKVAKVKAYKRFRKFVQSMFIQYRSLATIGDARTRWFKSFGDPRVYDSKTGELLEGEKLLKTPTAQRSNEVVHLKIYSARTPYGLPRYIGNLLSIFGDRASEEINYVTFRNNNIPSMVVMVSNGQLTQGSIDRIESFVESAIQGSDNYSKFLILEAEGDMEGEDGGQMKLEIKPLNATQQKDAMFQAYSKNNQDKIRRAFRLPPIFVGRADDYTRATADSSRALADEQIFAPERDEFDNLINRIIFPEMGIIYHKFKSNSPNTTDNSELTKILAGAEKTGGITPRIARTILEDILGRELPPFPDDFEADVPFSLTMAEAVKNLADPTQPGQQVTALKSVWKGLYGDEPTDEAAAMITDAVKNVTGLMALNKSLEKKWRDDISDLQAEQDE